MVKKTSMDERVEKMEQELQQMKLHNDARFDELKEILVQQARPRRGRARPPRRRVRNDEEPAVEDVGGDDGDSGIPTDTESSLDSSPVRHRHHIRGRKLEIPVFEGGEAYGWLVKVERYFRINGVEEDEMLEAVVIALDGRALNWYQWWEDQNHNPSWDEFKQAVIRRFQPSLVRNPLGPILSVKQTGSVMEYREQFELYMAPLKREERVMLESIFLNGLREDIQAELKLYQTRGLQQLMDRAMLIEEKNDARKKRDEVTKDKPEGSKWKPGSTGSGWDSGRNRVFVTKPKIEAGSGSGGPIEPKANTGGAERKQGVGKKLSEDELRELSRKGLCFKCGERWGKGHICKMKHYKVELIDEGEGEDVIVEEEVEKEPPEEETVEFKRLLLSLRSKVGLTSNQSFKVWGIINGRRVLILIDSGASANFISHTLVEELKLKLEDTSEYTIEIGNGEKITHKGVCTGLEVQVQGINVTQDFFLMTLAGTELVLGMDWLASLGDIKANFKNLVIKWEGDGQKFKIRGEPSLIKSQSSFRSVVKSLHQEEECYMLHYCSAGVAPPTEGGETLIELLLDDFAEVFQEPSGLPPTRAQDHAITLKDGAPIPHIRPYRYPHYQKDEIEKFVAEMLSAGIIRPSISPFSSPVLLVKKKDGEWRFCIDYRALNKYTIPDKFPIPVIDELLDEIGTANIFSKLDLKPGYTR